MGPGDDRAFGNDAGDNWLDFQNALHSVTVDLSKNNKQVIDDGFGDTDTVEQFYRINGSPHDDTFYGDGKFNELRGFLGDDQIHGGGGGDLLIGEKWFDGTEAGNDELYGGEGTDTLIGDYYFSTNAVEPGGDDILDGGPDDDYLQGGPGQDTFIFKPGYGSDTIADFELGQDVIDVSELGLSSYLDLQNMGLQVGSGAVFSFSDGSELTLLNSTLGQLSASDFLL